MPSKARHSADKVAKILNSTGASFYSGWNTEDQTSLDVLEDYFYDANEQEKGTEKKHAN